MARAHVRYAIFYTPATEDPLARFGAAWLGWDAARGTDVARPDLPGLPPGLTVTPRKYGFHGTLKAPFRLASGADAAGLVAGVNDFAARTPPAEARTLRLAQLSGFLALVPDGDTGGIDALAAAVVEEFDRFRAPLTTEDRDRRSAAALSPRQAALFERWGYPYVMEEFRFHLTLTGALAPGDAAAVEAALAPLVAPVLPKPFRLDALSICAEAADGRFHVLHRAALSG